MHVARRLRFGCSSRRKGETTFFIEPCHAHDHADVDLLGRPVKICCRHGVLLLNFSLRLIHLLCLEFLRALLGELSLTVRYAA